MARLTDAAKIAIKTKKYIESAIRAAQKLENRKTTDGKLIAVKRRIKPSGINVMITSEGKRFMYPYPGLEPIDAKHMIAGAPAVEIFHDGIDPDYEIVRIEEDTDEVLD